MMDDDQFNRLARKSVAKYAERLPEDEFAPIWRMVRAGDSHTAVRMLAEALVRCRTALTPDDKRELTLLLEDLGEPAERLDALPVAEALARLDMRLFARQTHAVIERLAPKLDPTWSRIITESGNAGSWKFAVTELAAILAGKQIPVAASDRDDLRRLIIDLGESTENVDRLNVGFRQV